MKRGQKHAVRHPWLSVQLSKWFILQIINCYSVVGERHIYLCGFFIVLHIAHTSLPMLAWMYGRGLNTSMFGSDSNCISG